MIEIVNPKFPKCWAKLRGDVYLVISDPEETIQWMNLTAYLQSRKGKPPRLIVFDGKPLTATAIWHLRDNYIPRGKETAKTPTVFL